MDVNDSIHGTRDTRFSLPTLGAGSAGMTDQQRLCGDDNIIKADFNFFFVFFMSFMVNYSCTYSRSSCLGRSSYTTSPRRGLLCYTLANKSFSFYIYRLEENCHFEISILVVAGLFSD